MPQAATRDELLAKSPMVAEMCKRTGFAFSPAPAGFALE